MYENIRVPPPPPLCLERTAAETIRGGGKKGLNILVAKSSPYILLLLKHKNG